VDNGSIKNFFKYTECILCDICIDNCPEGVIKYSWRHRKRHPFSRNVVYAGNVIYYLD